MEIHPVPDDRGLTEASRPEAEPAVPARPLAGKAGSEAAAEAGPPPGPESGPPALNGLEQKFQGGLVRHRLSHALSELSVAGGEPGAQAGDGAAVLPEAGPMTTGARLADLALGNDWDYRP